MPDSSARSAASARSTRPIRRTSSGVRPARYRLGSRSQSRAASIVVNISLRCRCRAISAARRRRDSRWGYDCSATQRPIVRDSASRAASSSFIERPRSASNRLMACAGVIPSSGAGAATVQLPDSSPMHLSTVYASMHIPARASPGRTDPTARIWTPKRHDSCGVLAWSTGLPGPLFSPAPSSDGVATSGARMDGASARLIPAERSCSQVGTTAVAISFQSATPSRPSTPVPGLRSRHGR